ncbi:MAG: hypothetical protein QW292_06910, partial [Candidatus Parvarchaeota archaeon]
YGRDILSCEEKVRGEHSLDQRKVYWQRVTRDSGYNDEMKEYGEVHTLTTLRSNSTPKSINKRGSFY